MADFVVNETNGQLLNCGDKTGPNYTYLGYLSLFPYALFACSMVGAITNLLWILTTNRRSSQISYMIDAIDEAVSELIANLRNGNYLFFGVFSPENKLSSNLEVSRHLVIKKF